MIKPNRRRLASRKRGAPLSGLGLTAGFDVTLGFIGGWGFRQLPPDKTIYSRRAAKLLKRQHELPRL
jgi:hypothetical protein